jgi:hypothetical protein
MPEIVKCPDCNRSLRVPEDLLGKTVRCPSCQVTFKAQAGPAEPPAPPLPKMEIEEDEERAVTRKPRRKTFEDHDDSDQEREEPDEPEWEDELEEDRPAPRKRKGRKGEWRKVRTGLTLILIGIFTQLVALLFIVIGLIVVMGGIANAGPQGGGPGPGANAGLVGGGLVMCVGGIMIFGAFITSVIGNIFCVYVPPLNGARALAITSLILIGLSFLAACGGGVYNATSNPGRGGGAGGANPFSGIGNLLSLAQMVVFIFFMRQSAVTLREHGLARRLIFFLVYSAVAVVASIAMIVVVVFSAINLVAGGGAGFGGAALGGLIVVGLLLLGMFIWYIVSLFMMRAAITRYVDR